MTRKHPAHVITNDSVSGSAEIERSVRFNNADGQVLQRTPSVAGNRKKWTFSAWIKRSKLQAEQRIFGGKANASHIYFASNDELTWDLANVDSGSASGNLNTQQVFRDISGWYHLVCALDTDESTANNRMRMYINGVEETAFDTRSNPPENWAINRMNNDGVHSLGRRTSAQGSDGMRFDGYMAEIQWVDGQQLDASYFGYTDTLTGTWRPKRYEGTYGTNGFHLDFSDNTSTTTLGYDKSGNNNHWTLVNLETNDALIDTPTNNFATCVMMGTGFSSGANYSQGNLQLVTGSSASARNCDRQAISNYLFSKGKWYAEIRYIGGNLFAGFGPW